MHIRPDSSCWSFPLANIRKQACHPTMHQSDEASGAACRTKTAGRRCLDCRAACVRARPTRNRHRNPAFRRRIGLSLRVEVYNDLTISANALRYRCGFSKTRNIAKFSHACDAIVSRLLPIPGGTDEAFITCDPGLFDPYTCFRFRLPERLPVLPVGSPCGPSIRRPETVASQCPKSLTSPMSPTAPQKPLSSRGAMLPLMLTHLVR